MKKIIRLTEGDLHRIIKKSVNKVLRENDGEDDYIDVDGLYNSLKTYNDKPVNINRDINYEPSDEEIMAAAGDFDLDTDFSNLMSGQYDESRRRFGRNIRESVRRVISEKHRPSGVSRRIHTRDANGQKQSFDYIPNLPKYNKNQNFRQASKFQRINARPVEDPNGEDIDTVLKDGTIERKGLHLPQGYYNVNNVGGTEHWGIDPKTFAKKYEADPTQQGVYKPKGGPMMASDPTKRNLAFQAPWGGRMDMKKGSRIMQDPNNPRDTYGIGGNEFDSTYKFDENTRRINRIVNESINNVLNEVEITDSDGWTATNLHGTDPDAWSRLARERAARMCDIDAEIENRQKDGYVDDLFGGVSDLKKEKERNKWNLMRNLANKIEVDNTGSDMSAIGVDSSDPEDRKRDANMRRDRLNGMRPDRSIKTKSRNGLRWRGNMPPRRTAMF